MAELQAWNLRGRRSATDCLCITTAILVAAHAALDRATRPCSWFGTLLMSGQKFSNPEQKYTATTRVQGAAVAMSHKILTALKLC